MKNSKEGSSLDDFLMQENIDEEANSATLVRVLAWQLKQLMQDQGLIKQAMANQMGTSRS